MEYEWDSALQPSISKACSRCYSRKVKCDLKVPRCSACTRHDEECNITDRVAYPYAAIQRLQSEIEDLRARLAGTVTPLQDSADAGTNLMTGQPDPRRRGRVAWDVPAKEAEEIGVLAVGGGLSGSSGSNYVGSAAGSTFARIFFKQLNLAPSWVTGREGGSLDQCPSERLAALPPETTAGFLLERYIDRVHLWWPFLRLSGLRQTLRTIYRSPKRCTESDKFLIFAMLALASGEVRDDKDYNALLDMNDSAAYFQTSLHFFLDFHSHPRDLSGIQAVLLLALWMLNSSSSQDCNDLWHLSRYLMSAAVEAGLHRHNADWGFSVEDLEVRNRTWWCIYNLERQVAITTGRVLSVRDHAIHALQPCIQSLDTLTAAEAARAPTFHRHNVVPFCFMIQLRRISGGILESIYIARGPDGTALETPFQRICTISDELRGALEAWRIKLDTAGLKPCRAYSELKIEYCMLQVLLHRPSPTFMVPSNPMVAACSRAASSAFRQWAKIEAEHGLSAVCRCFRQFHAILLTGLAALHCDWHAIVMARESTSDHTFPLTRHRNDADACAALMQKAVTSMGIPGLTWYQTMFQAVMKKVYSEHPGQSATPRSTAGVTSYSGGGETLGSLSTDGLDLDGAASLLFSSDEDMDLYRNHVSGLFGGDMFVPDDALNAWYETIIGTSAQPPVTSHSY